MVEVALVTYHDLPDLSRSDQLLLEPLREAGIQPVAIAWDEPDVDWQRFGAVILRSCWDYHKRPEEFRQWVIRLREQNVRLYNPPQTVLWNMEKHYLRALNQQGIQTIPTVWVSQGEISSLADVLASRQWAQAVLKPTIGASADGIALVTLQNAAQQQPLFESLLAVGDVMVQPVVEAIRHGELSLVFFLLDFSYAIRKLPGSGSIFVNSAYGGSRSLADVSKHIVKTAQAILDVAQTMTGNQPYLYARVDGVLVNGDFVLMEMELIEPGLLMDVAPPYAAQHFARVIAQVARKGM